jgi:S1-C subfamily serine protease
MNTAIFSPSGSNSGIGFAIPVDTIQRVVPQLLANGRITRPRLGVTLSDAISRRVTAELGVEGVLVINVVPDSPAAAAGVRGTRLINGQVVPGDVIRQVGKYPVRAADEFYAALEHYKPDDTIPLIVWRQGKSVPIDVTLAPSSP